LQQPIRKVSTKAVKQYYEDGGLKVLDIKGLEVSKPVDQVKLPDYASYKVAREPYGSIQQLTVC
jgi:maleate cis-trans isomerase